MFGPVRWFNLWLNLRSFDSQPSRHFRNSGTPALGIAGFRPVIRTMVGHLYRLKRSVKGYLNSAFAMFYERV